MVAQDGERLNLLLESPEPLTASHRLDEFECGEPLLDEWLKRRALANQSSGVRALLVQALHVRARQFYEHYGFQPSPTHPLTLMLRLPASA